jgi:WS/DGAT/MGAT family acyltransferase
LDRLSFDDAQILRLETEAIKGHTLKVLVLGPRPGGSRLTAADLRASVEARLDREPRARQRIVFGEGGEDPAWASDEDFDLARHVADAEVAEPVDLDGMIEIAAGLFERRLDHRRALWRADVVPMADSGAAVVMRIHHALADGITSQRFAAALIWDAAPDEGATVPPRPAAAASPTPSRAGAVSGAIRGVADPSRWLGGAREVAKLPGAVARELLPGGPETSLDRAIGPRREIARALLDLDELKGIAHLASTRLATHVTLNDVLLSLVGAGLRGWLDRGGRRPRGTLRAQVPVSLHGRGDDAELGNRDSFLNVGLELDAVDAFERLRLINRDTSRRKQAGDAQELYDFFHAISRFRPLYKGATRLASGPREFALSISNVPGPRAPVSVLGAEATELISIAEPADRHALRVSAISYAGSLSIGLSSDPEAVSELGALAAAIEAAAPELALAVA